MPYILGVDGGNSKTLAVLADESGAVLGVGRSGGSNHQGPGLEAAMEQVAAAARDATAHAPSASIDVAFCCLAGADLPEDFDLLRPALERLDLARCIGLDNDTIGALRSGTDNSNAVVVILGAGTNAAGRNEAGEEIRLPGLGWLSGDWGGGGDLAREAVSLVARAWDGRGEPTMLEHLVLQTLDLPDVESLIAACYHGTVSRQRVLHLAPLVFVAAGVGDPVALALVERQAREVVTTSGALLRRLDILDRPADVVLGGSVFRPPGEILVETITQGLASIAPYARAAVPELQPALGAAFCGFDMLGIHVGIEVRRRARETYDSMSGSAGRGG